MDGEDVKLVANCHPALLPITNLLAENLVSCSQRWGRAGDVPRLVDVTQEINSARTLVAQRESAVSNPCTEGRVTDCAHRPNPYTSITKKLKRPCYGEASTYQCAWVHGKLQEYEPFRAGPDVSATSKLDHHVFHGGISHRRRSGAVHVQLERLSVGHFLVVDHWKPGNWHGLSPPANTPGI